MKGGNIMIKVTTFIDSDKELVKKIIDFQKAQGLPSFIEAIRVLCNNALSFGNMIETYKSAK